MTSHPETDPALNPEKYQGAPQMIEDNEPKESKTPTANSEMKGAFTGEILAAVKTKNAEKTKREDGSAAYLNRVPMAIGSEITSNLPVSVPQSAHPRKYPAMAKSAAKNAAWIALLCLFWYAAMLNVLGPFALYHLWAWNAFIWLESFWMQTLHLPYPMLAPSYPFDYLTLAALLGSAVIRGGSVVRFLSGNIVAFEVGIFAILPQEMFDHVTYLTSWQFGGIYILNNYVVMALAQITLMVSMVRR